MSKRGLQIVAILLLPICMVLSLQNMETSRLKITMLDVGQGECICFQFPNNKVILSDGGSSDVSKVGTYRIKPYLLANGISNVDAVFISHWDEDHVSGIRELLTEQPREIQIKTLVLPKTSGLKDENLRELVEEAESAGVMVQFVQQGSVCTFAEATFTCLWPRKQLVAKNTNEYSGVFSLTYYDFRMLLAGDLPMEYEQELIHTEAGNTEESHGPLQDSMEWDVLKVAHHGSKYSTSPKLLEWIQPRFALISCGAQNSYGHPHEDLLKRLQEAGSKVLSTAECGAITLEIGQEIKMF